nr:MAG TPA: hypothetical protein [Caudoviricetes sp.]
MPSLERISNLLLTILPKLMLTHGQLVRIKLSQRKTLFGR